MISLYKPDVLFDLEKDTEDVESEKIPRIDDINSSIPMYIVFLLYADKFSQIIQRNETEQRMDTMKNFILFYIEFQIIEKFIASFDEQNLELFVHLFNRVFGKNFRPDTMPGLNNKVEVISITDTSSDSDDFSVDSLYRGNNNVPSEQQLTPYDNNIMSITNANTPYTNASGNQQLIQRTPFAVNATPIMGPQVQNIPSGSPITPYGTPFAEIPEQFYL